MLVAQAFGSDGVSAVDDLAAVPALLAPGDALVWVDLCEPSPDELHQVAALFDLHPLAVEDTRKHGQRPKLERYPRHAFIVAYGWSGDPRDLTEVELFVGPTWLVTVRSVNRAGKVFEIDRTRERFDATRERRCAVGYLLYTLLDDLVDGYFDALESVDVDLEELEEQIWDGNGGASSGPQEIELQQRLLRLRQGLLELRRRVVPMRDVVLGLLRREVEWVDEHNLVYFQDVLDHLLRIIDHVDNERELLGNAVDAHLATVANRTNDIMKKMTSWGAILIGANIITGVYGMNFVVLPGKDEALGFFFAITSMVVLTGLLFWYFRRKDWL
ncbi:MAG: magnesium/cobalt transporter CorA [Acidimicrobiales bacterium]